VQNLPEWATAISKFFTRPVFLHRSKDAGIVTVRLVSILGSQKLSVSFTWVKGTE
jgi:hypothetical protein